MHGPGTLERRLAINVALHVATQGNVFIPQKLELLINAVRKLEAMATLQRSIRQACDCTFVYWHRNLIGTYFQVRRDNNSSDSKY